MISRSSTLVNKLSLKQLLSNSTEQQDCNFKVSRMGDYKPKTVVTMVSCILFISCIYTIS